MKRTNSRDANAPIVCDMTDASDTVAQRLAEYAQLFKSALVGRERTDDGIRFRFRADNGVEDWVRDLAAREQACCAFFAFGVRLVGSEVHWDASVVDDDAARAILEELYLLPDTDASAVQLVHDRFAQAGLPVVIKDTGGLRLATSIEVGLRPGESGVSQT